MDYRLKVMLKELGDAINTSLSDSDQIAAVINRIKDDGYDIFLVLEATIGLNRAEDDEELDEPTSGAEMAAEVTRQAEDSLEITSQDKKFLKSLRIKIDDAN